MRKPKINFEQKMEVEPSRNKKPETGRLYSGKYQAEHFRLLFFMQTQKQKNEIYFAIY